jgi:general secretion pathway protein K
MQARQTQCAPCPLRRGLGWGSGAEAQASMVANRLSPPTPNPSAQGGRERTERSGGFIIVAVLWILGALATLVVIYSLYARETALEFVDHDERLQAQALAISGVELAAYRITSFQNNWPSLGRFSFRQGTAIIDAAFSAENGRIDLNFGPKELIAGLFVELGASVEEARNFADRVDAWRTPLGPGATDSEATLYQAAGEPYGPRHGPFQHGNELTMVLGMPTWWIQRALPYLTVYAGQRAVNVLSASPQVLAAVPGMTPELMQSLPKQGDQLQLGAWRAQLGYAGSFLTIAPTRTYRVDVEVRFASRRRMRYEAVILVLDGDAEPYRVLSWRAEELAADQHSAGGLY